MKQSFHTDFRLTNNVVFLWTSCSFWFFYHEVFFAAFFKAVKASFTSCWLALDLKGWFVHPWRLLGSFFFFISSIDEFRILFLELQFFLDVFFSRLEKSVAFPFNFPSARLSSASAWLICSCFTVGSTASKLLFGKHDRSQRRTFLWHWHNDQFFVVAS